MLDSDMKILKARNVEIKRKLKLVLSELDTVKTLLKKMKGRSIKLDNIVSSQKTHTDKHGIGYTDGASTSNAKGKNYFFHYSVVVNVAHTAAKKKNVLHPE